MLYGMTAFVSSNSGCGYTIAEIDTLTEVDGFAWLKNPWPWEEGGNR